jgi:PAS domain S-box-containing protein
MTQRKQRTPTTTNDIITIAILAVCILGLAIQYQLFKKLFVFMLNYQQYHVEELVFMLLTLSLLFAAFSYRRWLELKNEIAERIKAEQAQKLTEQRSEALLTTLPNLTFRIRRDGTYMDFRAGSPDDLYDSVDKIIGSNVMERLPYETAQQYMIHIDQALASNTIQTFEYELPIQGVIKRFQSRLIASGTDEVFVLVRNITNTDIISEALAKSETRFRGVVESLSEGLILTDLHDNILYMNQRMTELCGWTIEDVKNKPAYTFLISKDQWNSHQERNKRREQGIAERYEMQMMRKDGTTFWAEVYGSPFRDSTKKIIGTIGTVTDIADMKWNEQLQAALYRITTVSRSAHDMQQFFAQIHEIIGELMYAKNFYIAIHDPVSDIISFPYFVDEVDMPPPPRKFSHGSTEYILSTGKILHAPQKIFDQLSQKGVLELLGADAVDWLGVPLKSSGKTFGVIAVQSYDPKIVFTDREIEILVFVSQHVATVIQHRSEEERFRAVWEHSTDGMRVTDKNGFIVMVNEAYCSMVKKHKEELLGRMYQEVYANPVEDKQHKLEVYKKRFDSNAIIPHSEKQSTLWNHELLIVEVTRSYITFGINERMLLSTFRDISERKTLEDQLLHAQKMDSIGVLAGGIAHDFNNVLAMILGSAELIKHKAKDNNDILRFAQMIANAAERGSGIAKQLLMFARTEKGLQRPLSVSTTLKDVCKLLEHTIPKSITIQENVRTENDVVMADEDQLHQIIINLAVNAKDAIEMQRENGGALTFTVSNIQGTHLKKRFPNATNDLYVQLDVNDNGCGMGEEIMQRVFEPFFSTKERGKGTGLGLSIVHGIVKNHHGLIDVESTPAVGTTFRLYFPASHVVHTSGKAVLESQRNITLHHNNSKKILVVDDEKELTAMLKDILETEGYKVLTAYDGTDAISVYAENTDSIEIIISDLGMPNLDGRQLLRHLRENKSKAKFILMTGYLDHGTKKELVADGATEVLQKPFTFETVLDLVHRVFQS